jgi:ribosomal protein S12 methylthiotransferase accessory factor
MRRPYEALCRKLRDRSRTLAVLDLTSDFEIPAFAAVSAESGSRILLGTGAHLQADIALGRALGELCQVLQGVDATSDRPRGRRTTVERTIYSWLATATLDGHPYLTPEGRSIDLSAFADWSRQDIKEEIEWCIARARDLGLEVLALDMTRPDIGFPVARVIVPGMRHCWARLGPGRLYDVPVRMGWLARPLRESELNPQAYFL